LSNLNTKNNKAFINENIAIIPLTNGIKIGGKLVGKKAGIGIYNVTGKLVKVLAVNGKEFVWDGRDNMGRNLSSGCYLLRLTLNNNTYTKNFILSR
jgi:flagellar hook assembly protein FlgD